MELNLEQFGDIAVLRLKEDHLDASNAKDFRRDVVTRIESQQRVVFDMTEVQFVDSSGCGVLLSCLRDLNGRGGDLKLCGITKPVRALFELVRMHKIFEIYNNTDEALRSF